MGRMQLTEDTQWALPGPLTKPTIQGTLDMIREMVDLGGYNLTLSMVDPIYQENIVVPVAFHGSGIVKLAGNGAVLNPLDANRQLIDISMARMDIGGFLFNGGALDCLHISRAAYVYLLNNTFGRTGSYHIDVDTNATVTCSSNYTVVGGAKAHIASSMCAVYNSYGGVVTIKGQPSFSDAFISSGENALVQIGQTIYNGAIHGRQFDAHNGGGIATFRGASSVIPGTSLGTTQNGGWTT